jgi:hypothetical protein
LTTASVADIGQSRRRHQPAGAGHQRLGRRPAARPGIAARDHQRGDQAEAVGHRGADLVVTPRRATAGAAHPHPLALGRDRHPGEIAADIRQPVGAGVADLVEDLLGDRAGMDQAAGARGFLEREAAVRGHFHHRKAHVGPARRDRLPVGKQPPRGLRAAFDHMAGERALRQPVPVVRAPAEVMDQRAQRQRRIDHPAGDHHLGPGIERRGDRARAQIGIGAGHPFGQRPAVHRPHARGADRGPVGQQVVARHHRQAEGEALPGRLGSKGRGQRGRIHPAGVGDQPDALRPDLRQHRADRRQPVGHETCPRIARPLPGEDRHRHLGQIVAGQDVNPPALDQLARGVDRVAPGGRGVADAQRTDHSPPSRPAGQFRTALKTVFKLPLKSLFFLMRWGCPTPGTAPRRAARRPVAARPDTNAGG